MQSVSSSIKEKLLVNNCDTEILRFEFVETKIKILKLEFKMDERKRNQNCSS
jgi:hypothetical protein